MTFHSTDNLFLVEHAHHVEDFLKRGMRDKGIWIALGPSAMWQLDKKAIKYNIPEDFYSSEKLEDVCIKTHKKIEWLCNRLDDLLIEKKPLLKEWNIKPFLFNIFPLTILFDGLVSRIFQLKSILKHYSGYTIWIHRSRSHPWGIFDICFSNNETLYGHLLSLNGWDCQINLIDNNQKIISDENKNLATYLKNLLKLFVNQSILIKTIASLVKERNWDKLSKVFFTKNSSSILVNNGVGEWRHVIPILMKKGYRILCINDSFFKVGDTNGKIKDDFSCWFKDDNEIMSCFEYQGVFFFPLIKDRLLWIFAEGIRNSERIIKKTGAIIKKYNVNALLSITNASFVSHTVSQVTRNLKIPVLNWQHGFINYYNEMSQLNEFNDMLTSDVVMSYGAGVSDAYKKYSNKFGAHIVSIGNATLDTIKGREETIIKNNKGVQVLYVTSNYLQNTWYYGFSPPYSDRHFFQDQLCIMNFLQKIAKKECSITVKLHPITTHQSPPWVDQFRSKNWLRLVKSSPRFIELLKSQDIVIIDLPTTVLLEAISTNKPVFVLMRHWKYSDDDRKMLERRVFCADSVDILMNVVEEYIETGNYPASFYDDTFLKMHGNYLDDGKSIERAIKIFENAITQKEFPVLSV